MKALGTIVDLKSFEFCVASSRASKIRSAITNLQSAVDDQPNKIPAKLVASFVGLIWSIAACCHRAASVMVRSITAVLTTSLKGQIALSNMPLSHIVNRFWHGTVKWSRQAQSQLDFWSKVDFNALSAPISADVLGRAAENTVWYPESFDHSAISVLAQDASGTASGGGVLFMEGGKMMHQQDLFLAEFDHFQQLLSSTLRELLGILWCLKATSPRSKKRIIFVCDNWQSCRAILMGSRIKAIQRVAQEIFLWCLRTGRICHPVWIPRTHMIIVESDRRSRLSIPHDERSPPEVVREANRIANQCWGGDLSFDQTASHRSAISVKGRRLPFNAICMQPGASGVDTFLCTESWAGNLNYVFPPFPMLGRLITYLPSTKSRAVVAIKRPVPHAWWSFAIQPCAPGVVLERRVGKFVLLAFDFTVNYVNGPQCQNRPSRSCIGVN